MAKSVFNRATGTFNPPAGQSMGWSGMWKALRREYNPTDPKVKKALKAALTGKKKEKKKSLRD